MVKKLEGVKNGSRGDRESISRKIKNPERDSKANLSTVDENKCGSPCVIYKRGTGPGTEAKIRLVRKRCIQKAKIALSGRLKWLANPRQP